MELNVKTLQEYIEILRRRKWSFILPTISIFMIAFIAAIALKPIYRSTSTILIEEQEIPRDFVVTTVSSYAEQRLQSINQRIMSTTRLLEIINRFKLYDKYRKKFTTEDIVERMKKDIKFETISADVVDRRTGRPTAATIAFSLSYDGQSPSQVQQVASVLASLYLEENIKVREQQTAGASRFLDEETKVLKENLAALDAKIARFKEQNMNSLPELIQVNMQALDRTEQDIDRMNDQLRTLKEKEGLLQGQLASIPVDAVNQDKMLLKELKAKLVQLESRVSDKYPDVIKMKAEIAELERRLSASAPKEGGNVPGNPLAPDLSQSDNPAYIQAASQLAGTLSDIESVKRQIGILNKKRDDYRRRIELSPRIDETYKTLLLERNNTQLKYDDLMKKLMEAKVAQGLEKEQMGEKFTLIDPARVPEKPVRPNRWAIILIGLFLGIGAGVGIAYFQEYTDQSVRSSKDLANATSFPVLAIIPEIVTWTDKRNVKMKHRKIIIVTFSSIIIGFLIFHFFVMDVEVFWAKIMKQFIAVFFLK